MPWIRIDGTWDTTPATRQLEIAQIDGVSRLVDAKTQEMIKDVTEVQISCSVSEGYYAKITIIITDPAHIFPQGPIVDGQLVNQRMIEAERTV